MESLKRLQFTKKAPGTKWMKKLVQSCSLDFLGTRKQSRGCTLCGEKNVTLNSS
jgi:hypothetical protein